MANSTFSNFRSRFGSGGRGQDRYDEGGYDDYREYGYGYGNQAGDPYDDIDDVSGVGEVRTRTVASNARYYPPLLSFDEARVNTYVPDRLMRDPLEHRTAARGYERPGANYRPRVRDSIDMGRSTEYDLTEPLAPIPGRSASASAGSTGIADAGTEPVSASAATAPLGAGYDPYASFQSGVASKHSPTRKLKVLAPREYGEVESISRALKAGDVVALSLAETPGDLAKRVLDFSFGVASALDASVDCPAEKVFIITRGQALTDLERLQLQAQGVRM